MARSNGNVVWVVTTIVGLIAIGNVIFSAGMQNRDLETVAETNRRQDAHLQELTAKQQADHDCVTEVKGDVKHIKESVDEIKRLLTLEKAM